MNNSQTAKDWLLFLGCDILCPLSLCMFVCLCHAYSRKNIVFSILSNICIFFSTFINQLSSSSRFSLFDAFISNFLSIILENLVQHKQREWEKEKNSILSIQNDKSSMKLEKLMFCERKVILLWWETRKTSF